MGPVGLWPQTARALPNSPVMTRAVADCPLSGADGVWVYDPPDLDWDLGAAMANLEHANVCEEIDDIVAGLVGAAQSQDRVVIMSNGGFDAIHGRIEKALQNKFAAH